MLLKCVTERQIIQSGIVPHYSKLPFREIRKSFNPAITQVLTGEDNIFTRKCFHFEVHSFHKARVDFHS